MKPENESHTTSSYYSSIIKYRECRGLYVGHELVKMAEEVVIKRK